MAKKGSFGCMGCLATLMALGLFCALLTGVFVWWLSSSLQQDPWFLVKEYPGLVRTVSNIVLDPFHADTPLDIEEYQFNSEAYDSFMQKQASLVEVFEDSSSQNAEFSGTFTAEEIMTFVTADLAEYGIRRYQLGFHDGYLRLQASVPAQSFKKHLPEGWPKLVYQLYDTLQYLNVDLKLKAEVSDKQLSHLEALHLTVGDVTVPSAFLEKVNAELEHRRPSLSRKIVRRLNERKVLLKRAWLEEKVLKFEGLWNISP